MFDHFRKCVTGPGGRCRLVPVPVEDQDRIPEEMVGEQWSPPESIAGIPADITTAATVTPYATWPPARHHHANDIVPPPEPLLVIDDSGEAIFVFCYGRQRKQLAAAGMASEFEIWAAIRFVEQNKRHEPLADVVEHLRQQPARNPLLSVVQDYRSRRHELSQGGRWAPAEPDLRACWQEAAGPVLSQ